MTALPPITVSISAFTPSKSEDNYGLDTAIELDATIDMINGATFDPPLVFNAEVRVNRNGTVNINYAEPIHGHQCDWDEDDNLVYGWPSGAFAIIHPDTHRALEKHLYRTVNDAWDVAVEVFRSTLIKSIEETR